MNVIHITAEYVPFEEFYSKPYIKYQARRIPRRTETAKENNVAIILSIYTSVLAMALRQECRAEA
jgi:hypothetical protein